MDDKHKSLIDGVGKRRVQIVDDETGETLATGVLKAIAFEVEDGQNLSEAAIALDLPDNQ